MIEKKAIIRNKVGLHARPASLFVNFVQKYENTIFLKANGKEINPKSILGVMSLGLGEGAEVIVCVDGENAEQVANDIVHFLESLQE